MTNDQALGYGLLSLQHLLADGPIAFTRAEEKELSHFFAEHMRYLFDVKHAAEAEEQGLTLLQE